MKQFQSTLPVWGATLALALIPAVGYISIHAPRVGSDTGTRMPEEELPISIHAPRVGSDFGPGPSGATVIYFNPRSPCGERR